MKLDHTLLELANTIQELARKRLYIETVILTAHIKTILADHQLQNFAIKNDKQIEMQSKPVQVNPIFNDNIFSNGKKDTETKPDANRLQ